MGKKIKIGIVILVGIVVLCFLSFNFKNNQENFPVIAKTEQNIIDEPTPETILEYNVTSIDNYFFSNVKRYSVNVVTKTLDEDKIKKIGIEVIEQLKKEKPFNAASVFINDHEEFEGQGYSLGRIIYAPYGDWGKANQVSTGSYKNMKYDFDIKTHNIENQLSDFEASIVKQWFDTSESMDPKIIDLLGERVITDSVSQNNSITSDEVDKILRKFINWMYL